MEDLGVGAIHPDAPEFLSIVALYSAPIDVDAALERLRTTWQIPVAGQWNEVAEDPNHPELLTGKLYSFTEQGVQVLLTPMTGQLEVPAGTIPEHAFYLPITFYAPLSGSADGVLAGESTASELEIPPLRRRKRMVSAHMVMTQLADALMQEEAAIGIYRSELGVVQPPSMVTELAPMLARGEVPVPMWVNVRTLRPDITTVGRTLGLPLFGHLDLEVRESVKNADDLYTLLADISNYIIAGDSYLLPGQTLGSSDGERLALLQEVSPFDNSPVIRVMV